MNKFKKRLAIILCSLVSCACIIPAVLLTKATNVSWSEVSFSDEYLVADTVTVPERYLFVDGTQYTANVKVVFPDGSVQFLDGNQLSLSVAGKYTIVYQAKDGSSKNYSEQVSFMVAERLWQTYNSKTTVTYGTVGKTSGLLVSLAKNDTLTFNKIIDVNQLSAGESLLEGFINPTTVGTYEFDRLVFTFTDVADPTKVLTIQGTRSSSLANQRAISYWTAAGNGQTLGGWDNKEKTFVNYKPIGIRGAASNASFYSIFGEYVKDVGFIYSNVVADEVPFKLGYDNTEVKVTVGSALVSDLNEPDYYTSEPLWNGFPSGKVRLSVQAFDYAGESANFCIYKLFGYDFSQENKFIETEKPEITVDVEDKYIETNSNQLYFKPLAVVGGTYGVPTATAFDNYSGVLSVETKVYYNYGSETAKKECAIQNARFSITKNGTYAIVYKATDFMGNFAEKVYWITAVKQLNVPLAISLENADVLEGVCGQRIEVATPVIIGGSGDAVVTVTAVCGDTAIAILDGSFTPEKSGVWKIEYSATDYSGITVETSYDVAVENGDKPIFVEEPILPKYLVEGIEYEVPAVYANDYSTGVKQVLLAKMTVSDANGEKTYNSGEVFIPAVTESKPSVDLTFKVGSATLKKPIPVVSPIEDRNGRKYVHIEKMFVTKNAVTSRDKTGLTLLAEQDGDLSWLFANAVVADNATLKVKGIKGKSRYSGLKVTFTDYADSSISVSMYIANVVNGYATVKFGDVERKINKGLDLGNDSKGNPLDEFAFSYKLGKFYVDAISSDVAVDDSGKAFNGFPSGRIYISATVENATVGSGYIVKQLDNHTINAMVTDSIAPRIVINGVYGGMYQINDTYLITTANVSDTIDANVKCYLTVKDSNGNVVTDESGIYLDGVPANKEYSIKLTTYGQYIVEYSSTDCFDNRSADSSYSINVFDRVSPTAEIKGTLKQTASVGEQVELPEIAVSDNLSSPENISVYRYVRNPNGEVTALGYDYVVDDNGNLKHLIYKFTFRYAGVYRFVIIVTDETGNQTVVQYTVTVA
ncbi:MAG: hypothetical protein IJW26_05380 [Clostridia bacterium]|nr:hypothetical protein [Clostridia bacterium]